MPYNTGEYYYYDSASNMTWIQEYNNGNNTGQYLNYAYDNDERRSSMSGPLATVNMPAAMTATYGPGNQMLTWNGQGIAYDGNGNMTNDPGEGEGNLKFDERNRLSGASMGPVGGPYSAITNYNYDDVGRRHSWLQTVAPQSGYTYLYDGQNIAYITGSGLFNSYAVFEGLGLDDVFSVATNGNTNGNGAQSVLHDSLGSTTATEGPNGQIYGTLQYGPFGKTSVASGSPGQGPFLYTGRERDPTSGGLYYMRNRYYSSTLQRFLSPDPLGFSGGDTNLYAYVKNSPTNVTDRTGLSGSSSNFAADWGPGGGKSTKGLLATLGAGTGNNGGNSQGPIGAGEGDALAGFSYAGVFGEGAAYANVDGEFIGVDAMTTAMAGTLSVAVSGVSGGATPGPSPSPKPRSKPNNENPYCGALAGYGYNMAIGSLGAGLIYLADPPAGAAFALALSWEAFVGGPAGMIEHYACK